MAQKSQLVKEFGTKKAQNKMNSVMTNLVKDDRGLQKTTVQNNEQITNQALEVDGNLKKAKAE